MDIPRMSPSVRRITILQRASSGEIRPVTIYEGEPAKKKGTQPARFFEKITRRIADAQAKSAQSYLSRHEKSNAKKRDGWVQDLGVNVFRASQKGAKALKLNRLLSLN
jgi:hypothetical protein